MSGPRHSPTTFRELQPGSGADTTSFFQVQDADGGAPVLNVDTTNERIGVGIAAPAAKLDIRGDNTASGLTAALPSTFTVVIAETLVNGTDLGAGSWVAAGFGPPDAEDDWVVDTPETKATYTFDAVTDAASAVPILKQTVAQMDATGQALLASTYYKISATVTATVAFEQAASYFGCGPSSYGGIAQSSATFSTLPSQGSSGQSYAYFQTPSSTSGLALMLYPITFNAAEGVGVVPEYIFEDISLLDATLITCVGHGLAVGQSVKLPCGAAGAQTVYTVASVVNADAFTINTAALTTVTGGTGYSAGGSFRLANAAGEELLHVDGGTLSTTGLTGLVTGTGEAAGSNVVIGVGAAVAPTSAADGIVAIGASAAAANTSGEGNTAIGYQALLVEDDGDGSTAVGYRALAAQTGVTGDVYNTAIGHHAAVSLTTGISNVFVGVSAGAATLDVDSAVIIGAGAGMGGVLTSAADGTVAIGAYTLSHATTAAGTTVVGSQACYHLQTGSYNTAFGYEALKAEEGGDGSTAIGYQALKDQDRANRGDNPDGGNGTDDGETYNTAVGYRAGQSVTTGKDNTIIGGQAASSLTTGSSNTFVGNYAGSQAVTVNNAVAIGAYAGAGTTHLANGTVSVGNSALGSLTTGIQNTAVGTSAMWQNQASDKNTAIGYSALGSLNTTDAGENVAVGNLAGYSINGGGTSTNGIKNVVVGDSAGYYVEEGSENTFIGHYAGYSTSGNMLDGDKNTAVGAKSGYGLITVAQQNAFLGYYSGFAITTGSYNVAVGSNALKAELGGAGSTAVGYNALAAQNLGTSGEGNDGVASGYPLNTAVGYAAASGIITGSYNAALGAGALMSETGGSYCTAVGAYALSAQNSSAAAIEGITGQAINNTAVGTFAGEGVTLGTNNTLVGASAGTGITTGQGNTCIGDYASVNAGAAFDRCVIGTGVQGTANETIYIGGWAGKKHIAMGSGTSWSHSSDIRMKKNIEDADLGLDFINKLRTVTYNELPKSEWPEEWHGHDPNKTEQSDKIYHGLIAQEVKAAMDECGVDYFTGWSAEDDGHQSVGFASYVLPLVKAVQELSAKVAELEFKLENQ